MITFAHFSSQKIGSYKRTKYYISYISTILTHYLYIKYHHFATAKATCKKELAQYYSINNFI